MGPKFWLWKKKRKTILVLLTSIILFINTQKLQFLIIVAGKKVINCKQEQQKQQQCLFSGYKLKYCEFHFFFNKNLKCNYISVKDQMFWQTEEYLKKSIWLAVEVETTACNNWADYNFKPFICLEKDIAMTSLGRQWTLMALLVVYVDICTRGNVLIYHKATGIDMQNFKVAGVIVVYIVTVI